MKIRGLKKLKNTEFKVGENFNFYQSHMLHALTLIRLTSIFKQFNRLCIITILQVFRKRCDIKSPETVGTNFTTIIVILCDVELFKLFKTYFFYWTDAYAQYSDMVILFNFTLYIILLPLTTECVVCHKLKNN